MDKPGTKTYAEKKSPTSTFWIFTQTVNFLMEGKDWGREQIIISCLQLVYENTCPGFIYFPLSQKPTIATHSFILIWKFCLRQYNERQWKTDEGLKHPQREKKRQTDMSFFFFLNQSEKSFFCWFWILDCSHYILNFTAIDWNASSIERNDFEINKA